MTATLALQDRHPDTLLTIDEFCGWLGISKRTFTGWCQDGLAPQRLKVGRQVRIRWSDALKWAESNYVPST